MDETLTLRDLCDPKSRPWLRSPFHLDGWSIATDGKAMLCCRGQLPECEPATEEQAAKVRPFLAALASLPASEPVDPVALRQWCGSYDPWEECPKCNGEGDCQCDHCGNEHDCHFCGGNGGRGADVRHGLILGVWFDRNQLAKYLRLWMDTKAVWVREAYRAADARPDSLPAAALVGETQALFVSTLYAPFGGVDCAARFPEVVPPCQP